MSDQKEIAHKFVIVLNKKVEPGIVMNAGAHMALGLVAKAPQKLQKQMKFMSYFDADNNEYPSISAWPVIILRGKHGDIKKFLTAVREKNLLHTVFTNTMTVGGYKEQIENTKKTSVEKLTFYGVAAYGTPEELNPLTKKFSLWK